MLDGQCGHEGLIVQSRCGQSGVGKRLSQDSAINFPSAQHLHEFDGEILLQHQRHLRRLFHDLTHQVRQQIRANGVDHTQTQSPGQGVFAALGNFFDFGRLLQHKLCVANDFFAQRRSAHLIGAAFEQLHIEFFLEFLNGHRQGGLRHEARFSRFAKVPFAGYRHNVFQLSQGHANFSSFQIFRFSAQPASDVPLGHVGVFFQQLWSCLPCPFKQMLVCIQVSKSQQSRPRLSRT